jgi:hypothetical protein
MTPNEFLDNVVRPNVAAFHQDYASLRHAFNAIASVDALAAHLFVWCKANKPAESYGANNDIDYRYKLASLCPAFALLRDIAKAQKHVHLTQGKPQITHEHQVTSRPVGFGEGGWGCGRWGGPPQVVVDIAAGELAYLEEVVDKALAFIEGEMQRVINYDVILQSVTDGFRGPVIAAVLTLTKQVEHEGEEIVIASALGLDLRMCAELVDSAPAAILRGVACDDAEQAKQHLEKGHFPPDEDWPRPEPGQVCCIVKLLECR